MSKIVNRTLDFFEAFADAGRPLSLSELSKTLKLPASSCHDVLQALLERGYVYELAPRGGFYPTLKLQELTTRIVANDPVLPRAEQRLRELRDRFDESVLMSRVDGEKATYLLVLEPSFPLRFLRRVGDSVKHLHATSVGKALLGSLDERQRRRVVEKLEMVPLTEHTLRSKEALLADIEQSKARGWYISREEGVPSAITISTTFKWVKSTFIITVAGPTFRLNSKVEEVATTIMATAAELSNPGGRR